MLNRLPVVGSNRVNLKFESGSDRSFVHRGSNDDLSVLHQIFISEDYSIRRLPRCSELLEAYRSIVERGATPLILDAGSNIGASVVYFAHMYPEARIVAFEPDVENFGLLTRNVAGIDVEAHRAAIGPRAGTVSILDPGEGAWGYRTAPDANGSCPMMSISDVVAKAARENLIPFIVKIDIEGGEASLFEEATDWVDKFPILIIELHDWLLPRQRSSQSFLKCISKHDREFIYIGENIFSIKVDL